MPPGLSKRDQKVLRSVKRRAHYLDKGFKVCGMRFGWTFLIGIIPGAGDVTDAALNYTLVLRRAQKAELPPWLIQRMLVNNVISAGVGFVPLVGDVILAQWKANSRNAALLEEYLRVRGEVRAPASIRLITSLTFTPAGVPEVDRRARRRLRRGCGRRRYSPGRGCRRRRAHHDPAQARGRARAARPSDRPPADDAGRDCRAGPVRPRGARVRACGQPDVERWARQVVQA
jgi:hypothetical protein